MVSSKFDDTVFQTLDSVVPSPARQRVESLGGLGDPTAECRFFSSALAIAVTNQDIRMTSIGSSVELQEDESSLDDRRNLAELLQQEQQALELESSQLHQLISCDPIVGTNPLLDLCQDIANMDGQTSEVQQACIELQKHLLLDQFLLDSHRIRLVRDLSHLFPITYDATNGDRDVCYRIRGLQLPNSAQGLWIGPTTIPEDEVSAGLGYTVQLMNCLSRYMSVDMRHSMWFQSSRSSIQDATTGAVYPLFSARQDREKFAAGWELLDSNANRLVIELQLPVQSSKPLLSKIQEVCRATIGGTLRTSGLLENTRTHSQVNRSVLTEST
jgi:hypothetical protein